MYDIIIIGGGPAGLTAAIFGVRAGKKVLLLEGGFFGGQIIEATTVNNYPGFENISGFDLAINMQAQAKMLGAELKTALVTKVDFSNSIKEVWCHTQKFESKTIIIATGASAKHAGLAGERELLGRGVSYCATCDGALYKGKDVAIVGGGTEAINDAITLSDLCKNIYLINSHYFSNQEQDKLSAKPNITVLNHTQATDILGKKKVESVKITDLSTNTSRIVSTNAVFISVGKRRHTELFKDIIDIDQKGYIIAGEDLKTNIEGVFVAGDVRTKSVRQLVTATSDGAVAAVSAARMSRGI